MTAPLRLYVLGTAISEPGTLGGGTHAEVADMFRRFEREARAARRGLWGAPKPVAPLGVVGRSFSPQARPAISRCAQR